MVAAAETRAFYLQELKKQEKWEAEQKDLWFWEKLGRLPFVLLDKLTPAFIQEKLAVAINELGSYIQSGGQYLISDKEILQRFQAQGTVVEEGQEMTVAQIKELPLLKMDEVATEIRSSRVNFATFQGATTGIGGIFTLAIDVPMLLGLSLKVLQEIALCYGYDPRDKAERIFIVKCLQFSSSDIVGKKAILDELTAFQDQASSNQMISQLQGWREVVVTYRDNFGWKKLFQIIPVAGMLFGAWLNRSTVEDVAEAGMMLYRKRRILERLKEEPRE
ncbi:EcsC family protein [Brevibacillus migulae]|uniref:EcsC family protein n=1 Tax=Brevibacillus migulae TaxID=1644114 RepID=UPI001F38DE77|nr:EcsC family protein [Brevibacillus migulae]